MPPVRRQISPHAGRLRRDATDAEQRLWMALRNRQIADAKFRRQATLGRYVVDFLCAETNLVVEVDGGQHTPAADAARSSWLQAQGYVILRFWNNDVLENLEGVVAVIEAALQKKTLTQPSPAKAGEG
jgi:very-short-patch-repair endonuclease